MGNEANGFGLETANSWAREANFALAAPIFPSAAPAVDDLPSLARTPTRIQFLEANMNDHDDSNQSAAEPDAAEPAAQQPAEDEPRPNQPAMTVCISERKLEANRRNGAKGGVKTEEGKRKSRRNSLKHGMRATTLLVEDDATGEGQEYQQLREALEQEYGPRTTTEHMLIDEMALAILRTRSGRVHERQELAMDSAFQYPAIDRLVRYGNAANKLFFKALAELQKLQKEDVDDEQ